MNQKSNSKRPASAKARRASQTSSSKSIAGWVGQHLMLVTVIVLAILVFVVILIAVRSGDEAGPAPRPDSSGPIRVGELQLNIHQWNCNLTEFEEPLNDPGADPIRAAEGNHFCTLSVEVTNLNLDKARAFDPAGQRIVFGNQEYVYNPIATRDGLGATPGVRILKAGTGTESQPDTVPPLINMVFEIPQDSDGLAWRSDAVLALTSGSGDDETPVEIPLKDYDKQT